VQEKKGLLKWKEKAHGAQAICFASDIPETKLETTAGRKPHREEDPTSERRDSGLPSFLSRRFRNLGKKKKTSGLPRRRFYLSGVTS